MSDKLSLSDITKYIKSLTNFTQIRKTKDNLFNILIST